MSLGGFSDVGCKNCYALLYNGKAYLFDCGQEIPDGDEEFGPRHVPDFSLLIGKASEVAAIFVSHAHLDHIGALGKFRAFYEANYPFKPMPRILVSNYSARVIGTMERWKREEVPMSERIQEFLEVVEEYETFGIGDAEFFFFPVIHSISGAMGCSVKIGGKRVVYLGDCKGQGFPNATETFERDLERSQVHSPDVLLLDSTGADKEGFAPPDYEASLEVARVIRENNHRRILVALFASHTQRVEAIAYLVGEETRRPIFINGRSLYMHSSKGIANLNLLRYPKKAWHKDVPDDAVIFVTGSQGEPNAVLNRLEKISPHPLRLRPGDAVIFSASTIPGNEPDVEALLEKLSATGCTIYLASESDGSDHRLMEHAGKYAVSGMFHTSGHGHRQDLERIVEINGPAKILPVHADQDRRAMVQDLFPDRQVLVPGEHDEVVL
ncbi:MAG: ribonuclease J [Candidatus Spechtbacteria bacterium]|nr:ribonuclease J [Candidatus Spechtbacteria bacterium]